MIDYQKITRTLIEKKKYEQLLRMFLTFSYTYYIQDYPLVSDGEYDNVCKTLLDGWNSGWTPSQNIGFINGDVLSAGTGFHIPANKYPFRVVSNLNNNIQHDYSPDYLNGWCVLYKEHGGFLERTNSLERFFI